MPPLALSSKDAEILKADTLRIISWNLYYRKGAAAADISALIEQEQPDLFLMQEATRGIETLPRLVNGTFFKQRWRGKDYSLAAWLSEDADEIDPKRMVLPFSNLPGTFPPRVTQVIRMTGMTIANVHLSHGQMLNRRQLRRIADAIEGPLAIIGDFNALGPIVLRGFEDVGPRKRTHLAQRMVPLRLDRCLVRDIDCLHSEALERGPSDHRPILLELKPS